MSSAALEPYISHFEGKTKLSSHEFLKIFKKFDTNGNGFIEAGELDEFLKALWKEKNKKGEPDSEDIKDMREEIMSRYDTNYDGKIDLEELLWSRKFENSERIFDASVLQVAKILPTEDNFLVQFQYTTCLTCLDFFKVWHHYDSDRSGFIESEELQAFLTDLLGREGRALSSERIVDYSNALLDLFDKNKDGKLSLSEMSKILPVEENVLLGFERDNTTDEMFNHIWKKYDKDGNGFIADTELDDLIRDMMKSGNTDKPEEFQKVKQILLEVFDTDKDGKFKKEELTMMLVGKSS